MSELIETSLEVENTTTNSADGNEDLSSEIARTVPRTGREQVTCRRISKNHYRCNWWVLQDTAAYDNPSMIGSLVTANRISQSEFLHVTKTGTELKIRIVTR
jgi:hypothetical protein